MALLIVSTHSSRRKLVRRLRKSSLRKPQPSATEANIERQSARRTNDNSPAPSVLGWSCLSLWIVSSKLQGEGHSSHKTLRASMLSGLFHFRLKMLAPQVGLEPTTLRLTEVTPPCYRVIPHSTQVPNPQQLQLNFRTQSYPTPPYAILCKFGRVMSQSTSHD